MKNNVFGVKLRELRIDKKLSQRALGEVFSVSNQTVSFWETGSREPDLDTIVGLAHYFGVTVDDLLEEK